MIYGRFQQKIDTSVNWAKATNFIPLEGELIIYQDYDENNNPLAPQYKNGDGKTKVNDLPFNANIGSIDGINQNPIVELTINSDAFDTKMQVVCDAANINGHISHFFNVTRAPQTETSIDLIAASSEGYINNPLWSIAFPNSGSYACLDVSELEKFDTITINLNTLDSLESFTLYINTVDSFDKVSRLQLWGFNSSKPTSLYFRELPSMAYSIDNALGQITINPAELASYLPGADEIYLKIQWNTVTADNSYSDSYDDEGQSYEESVSIYGIGKSASPLVYWNPETERLTAAPIEVIAEKRALKGGIESQVLSNNAFAYGHKTIAGMTGLRYVLMQKNVPSSGKTTFYIDGDVTDKLSIADTYSIITHNEYINYGRPNGIALTDIPEGQESLFTQPNATSIVFTGADFVDDSTVDLTKDPYKKTIFVIAKPKLGLALSEDILEELSKEGPGEDIGTNTFAVGVQSRALGYGSTAFGKETIAYGSYAFVEGRLTEAMYAAHAEGRETKALGDVSHAEGYQTKAIAAYAHAEGAQTHAEEQAAHAEGYKTYAKNLYTHAEGQITNASGVGSHTEGYNTATGGDFTTNTLTASTLSTSGAYAHAEGNATVAIGQAAHAEGRKTFAKGRYAHAEGYKTSAIGDRSHVEGSNTNAIGSSAHAEGANDEVFSSRKAEVKNLDGASLFTYNTTGFAEGESSHKEGYNTTAFGKYSHVEGSGGLAYGEKSHAEGSNTNATGSSAHAEGAGTSAYGPQSHAEGYKTNALGSYSHAECEQTWATGQAAHAEGQLSKATNIAAHAEGYNTTASGVGAHAEGSGTTASGDASHASGVGTKATADYQTVIGKYNAEDNSALFVVGVGTGDAAARRANAFTAGNDGTDDYITIGEEKLTEEHLRGIKASSGVREKKYLINANFINGKEVYYFTFESTSPASPSLSKTERYNLVIDYFNNNPNNIPCYGPMGAYELRFHTMGYMVFYTEQDFASPGLTMDEFVSNTEYNFILQSIEI